MPFSREQEKELMEVLGSWGLDAKEQVAYRALLTSGPATLTPLARALGVALTTAQAVVRRLVRHGLVTTTLVKSRARYEAAPPSRLKSILEERARDAARIAPLLASLAADTGRDARQSRVRVWERERATEAFLAALAAKKKLVYEIVSGADIQDVLGERFHFTARRLEAGIRLKSLRVESREIKKYSRQSHVRELREARFLPRDLTFAASFMCWDDSVAVFSAAPEGLAVVIESPSLREAFLQVFGLLWSVSRPMETVTEPVSRLV